MAFRAQLTRCAEKPTKGTPPKKFYECWFADAAATLKLKAWDNSAAAPWCAEMAQVFESQAMQRERVPVFCVEVSGNFSKGEWGVESNDWKVRALTDDERAAFFLGHPEMRAKQDRDWRDINGMIDAMQDRHFRVLCQAFLRERGGEFRRAAAARGNHHARPGGLVEHVAGMMRAVNALAACYDRTLSGYDSAVGPGPDGLIPTVINGDLLLAGVLFHDCGKLWENQYVPDSFEMPFTPEAELMGHIAIGSEVVKRLWTNCNAADAAHALSADADPSRSCDAWPADKLLHLRHLILSHHGTKEWGSPTEPRTYEAFILHYVDNLDARMEMARAAFATARRVAPGITDKIYPLGHGLVETPRWELPPLV